MLTSRPEKQPIDQTLAALARQYRMHVVPHQAAAQQQRVRSRIRAPALLNAKSRNIEGLQMLALDQIMLRHCALARDQLRHRIRKRDALTTDRRVILDHRNLGFILRHNQVPRMGHRRRIFLR